MASQFPAPSIKQSNYKGKGRSSLPERFKLTEFLLALPECVCLVGSKLLEMEPTKETPRAPKPRADWVRRPGQWNKMLQ